MATLTLLVWLVGLLVFGVVMGPASPQAAVADAAAAVMRWVDPDGWEWIDEERRRRTPRPNVEEVVALALKAHGQAAVSRAIGLSRQTCLAIGGGFATLPMTLIVAGLRMREIARLSEEL